MIIKAMTSVIYATDALTILVYEITTPCFDNRIANRKSHECEQDSNILEMLRMEME